MKHTTINEWINTQGHMPTWLRDFHNQKDVFKAIDQEWGSGEGMTWVQGHCYTIDKFLRFMAAHGYTLQRSRKRLVFADLGATLDACQSYRLAAFKKALDARTTPNDH